MNKLKVYFCIIIGAITLKTTAQGFDNVSRAVYIFDIAKYVSWKSINQTDTFTIGILEPVTDLFPFIDSLAIARANIQNRPIKTLTFKTINDISQLNIIYVNKRYNYDIAQVMSKIRGKNTLLISENYEFHRSMINFIVHDGKKSFELNKERLNQEGLFVNELFVEHAIKSETDWINIYQEIELELENEKTTVEQQNKAIEKQLLQINNQANIINSQRDSINIQTIEILKQITLLKQFEKEIEKRQLQIANGKKTIETLNTNISNQTQKLQSINQQMLNQQSTLNNQELQINLQNNRIVEQIKILGFQAEQIEKQKIVIWFIIIILLFALILAYYIYKSYKIKQQANIALQQKNNLITHQRNEIQIQKDDITIQRDKIAEQNKLITDSLYYAQRIQQAILPDENQFKNVLDQFFIFYQPKDIVSGDFYWQANVNDETIIVAADCTGHGVPGALMSMLGITFLNDIVNNKKITQPSDILNNLRDNVIDALKQRDNNEDKIYDGMDAAAITINKTTNNVQYAGAYNPLFLIRNGELLHYKADRMPVAVSHSMISFNNNTIELQTNDRIYIFSDGYIDQFGGEKGKKFMRKQLESLLLDIYNKPMRTQKEIICNKFFDWKGINEQTDDVVFIGIKI